MRAGVSGDCFGNMPTRQLSHGSVAGYHTFVAGRSVSQDIGVKIGRFGLLPEIVVDVASIIVVASYSRAINGVLFPSLYFSGTTAFSLSVVVVAVVVAVVTGLL